MFFLISGANASGKSMVARLLPARLTGAVCHDADEMVAMDADTRCAQLEIWVQRALDAQQHGQDFLLATNSPLGELLACPSAPELDGIVACLLDCDDSERVRRYVSRGIDPRWPLCEATLGWSTWHRGHARDPQWEPHVVDRNGPPTHRYDRWRGWTRDDPRWRVFVLDTTSLTEDETLGQVLVWMDTARTTSSPLSPGTRWWTNDLDV